MDFKYFFIFLTAAIGLVCASRKTAKSPGNINSAEQDRIKALFIKDNENGELRFLTGSANSNTNINSAINQFITQKQNALENLRPNNGGALGTGTGTLGTGTLGTLTGGTGSGSINGVTPIIVSLGGGGGGGGGGGTGGVTNPAFGASPIVDLLPQIIAQGVFQSRRGANRGRVGNRRRPVRRNNKNNRVYVLRP